jgi:lipopolysaccharide biosynthesis protein
MKNSTHLDKSTGPSAIQGRINENGTHVKRIAMYVIFDKDGILDGYRKYYLQELRKVTDYVIAIVNGTLTPESRDELEKLTDDIYVRENTGLLAYGWIEGLQHIGWDTLDDYDELLMLNDSFFGPFFPLEEMFNAMEKSDADFYGALKNFEEESITSIDGRPMKRGHFPGSICYFYIIRKRLLHSHDFREYWERKPEINRDWDTYFYSEIDFFQYVQDAGFRIDAYQSDKLKGYFFDTLTHNMSKLIIGDRIPFARIRSFCTDMKDQSSQINYGKDPRQALEYIDKHTNYDTNLIWDYILRTKNLTDIWNQLQLEYVVSKDSVEKPFTYEKKIAVILHIYYKDQVELIADYCNNFIPNTDFYITTTSEETEQVIIDAFNSRKLHYVCKIRPNVGVAMSTLWITYADIVTKGDYEYICYFHDKKSPYHQFSIYGEQFAERCYQNLFGTKEVVKNIINLFEQNPRLGVLGPPMVYHSDYFMAATRGQGGNYQNIVEIAKKLNLDVNIDINKTPMAPYGDMFWFRRIALKKAIGHGFTYDDFNIKYSPDFTMFHAIERSYGFMAQDSGYYSGEVINSDDARSDLINYRYMLEQLCTVLIRRGSFFGNYEQAKQLLNQSRDVNPWKNKLKKFLYHFIESNDPHTRQFGLFLQRLYRRWFKRS